MHTYVLVTAVSHQTYTAWYSSKNWQINASINYIYIKLSAEKGRPTCNNKQIVRKYSYKNTLTAGLAVLSSVTQALMMSSTAIWMAVMLGVICCRSSTTSG